MSPGLLYLVAMGSGHNLVLTGFMGTGKTTVGRLLASKLDMAFVDTDVLIESRHGPIASIFEESGEAEFREIERSVARELGQRVGLVIATGGRMVLDPESHRDLTRTGRIFCLVASVDEIHRRVTEDSSGPIRPLLDGDDLRRRIDELLAEREAGYGRFPQVATDQLAPDEVADRIVEMWNAHGTQPDPAGDQSR